MAPGSVGIEQINVRLPSEFPPNAGKCLGFAATNFGITLQRGSSVEVVHLCVQFWFASIPANRREHRRKSPTSILRRVSMFPSQSSDRIVSPDRLIPDGGHLIADSHRIHLSPAASNPLMPLPLEQPHRVSSHSIHHPPC